MRVEGDPGCIRCSLHKTTERVCVMGVGNRHKKVMIVGEAPGAAEEQHGEPFKGQAGQMLSNMLKRAGIQREDVYITNAVHCRPPKNRTPKKKEIEACKVWLQKEMRAVKPRFVMLLGNIACQSVLGMKGIKNLRGRPIEQDGVIYFPTYHPAFALRVPKQEPVLRHDIEDFAKIVKQNGIIQEKENFKYTIVTDRNLFIALKDIADHRVVSRDCETSSLDPWAPGSYVTSVGIGTSTNNWCFPLQHPKGDWYNKPKRQAEVIAKLDAVMTAPDKVIVGHNGKFDTNWMRVIYGVKWYDSFDTLLAHYNLDENALHGLDILAREYFGAVTYDIPLEEKHGFGPLDRHCRYLALDCFYTRKLYFKFLAKLRLDRPTQKLFFNLTMPVARLYADIEFTGFYVDLKKLREAKQYWEEIATEALKKLDKLCPSDNTYKNKKTGVVRTGVNWGSPQQLAEILFEKLKLKPLDLTPGGEPSTSESVLKRLADQHKIPKLVLTYREASKNLNTFIIPWMKRQVDGYVHPTFKVFGAVTGRPSCEHPNLQQVPRDPRIRSIICAPPGWTLVDVDESQVELRLTAEASKDPELTMSYTTNSTDVHTLTVQRLFGIMEPTKEERKKGKAINFGFIYGMGWKKFKIYARDNYEVEFSDAECKRIRNGFFRLYYGLPDWHSRQRKYANRNGYVRNLIGRLRRLPDAMRCDDSFECGEAERQAINSPIQSLASDINLLAGVELHQRFDYSFYRPCGTVHDSNLILVRNDKLKAVLPIIKRTLEKPKALKEIFDVELVIPLVAEVETGPWASGTKWEPGQKVAVTN